MQVEINTKLYKDIEAYCTLNGLDITELINKLIKQGYMLEKYGDRPGIPYKPLEESPQQVEVKQELQPKMEDETNEKPIETEKVLIETREEEPKDGETLTEEPKKERRRKLS